MLPHCPPYLYHHYRVFVQLLSGSHWGIDPAENQPLLSLTQLVPPAQFLKTVHNNGRRDSAAKNGQRDSEAKSGSQQDTGAFQETLYGELNTAAGYNPQFFHFLL